MIRNERQLGLANKKLRDVEQAASQASGQDRQVWLTLAADVRCEIDEYISIKNGTVSTFELNSVDDISDAIVKARIAKGLTQSGLADLLDISEQMVQKNESGGYENASLNRLADACDVLGYELKGRLQPSGSMALIVADAMPVMSNEAASAGNIMQLRFPSISPHPAWASTISAPFWSQTVILPETSNED